MLDYFEKTASNRSTCSRCKKTITDPKRGVAEGIGYGGYKTKKYYCLKCSGEVIKEAKKELQAMEETLNSQFDKLNKREIPASVMSPKDEPNFYQE